MGETTRTAVAGGLLALCLAGDVSAGGDSGLVDLELHNAGTETLRCVTVLAHFVSLPAMDVAPGTTWTSTFHRTGEDGTLFVLRDDGREMMVENLICGSSDDWDKTRGEVPLLNLRSTPANQVLFSCKIASRLTCESVI
jgi:hypothetical protein